MKRNLIAVIILAVLMLTNIATAATKKPKDTNVPWGPDQQIPQQLDCQQIEVDETEIGGKIFRKKLCFYDVMIGSGKRHVIMWHEVGTDKYGFGSNIGIKKPVEPQK